VIDRLRHLAESIPILRARARLEAHEKWSPERLRIHQRRRLLAIIRHAAAHSPFYRERFAGIELSDDLDLAALPRLDKAMTQEHFDELVTDRRLTLARVRQHMAEMEKDDPAGDPKLLGE
jgi:phenylacetate-coenzyme A ligase PaaK-like adenylate-forming protein